MCQRRRRKTALGAIVSRLESIDPKTKLDLSTIPRVDKADSTVARIEIAIEKHLLFKDLDTETRRVLILSMSERNVLADERVIRKARTATSSTSLTRAPLTASLPPRARPVQVTS